MAITYPDFDGAYARWHRDVYRLCFLLVQRSVEAEEMTFQTFLKLGAKKLAYESTDAEKEAVFSDCLGVCENYFYRKARKKPKRDTLKALPFPVTDDLWALLQCPFSKKAAFFLHRCLGFSSEQTGKLLRKSARWVEHALPAQLDPGAMCAAAESILLDDDGSERISDRILLRFEERNVAFENKLQEFRLSFDRAVPYIALVLLLIMALAAWYSAARI